MDRLKGEAFSEPKTIFLKNYSVPLYLIDTVNLDFDLYETKTIVKSELKIQRNPKSLENSTALKLNGFNLKLISVMIDCTQVSDSDYELQDDLLVLDNVPEDFLLTIITEINPLDNLALEGLYLSSGMYCTQCEAQGFRRMTYFLDRPDVMSLYTVTVHADKENYPILLSNGNCIKQGSDSDSRHWVTWHDPFPKPCYLFALVAGDLFCKKDSFKTISGKTIDLLLYVEHENKHKCEHALLSLKQAMAWDEQVFGREYDLDNFMIVAVNDFNMGAMENKGLNVFNSSCVLASPETTTDADYYRVQGIIGHEYFHNWSGNRVTCRDWFQLSLKEGFTVFRDQQFSADMNSAAVQRIDDVNILRNSQFSQDAGPMAHPVRPQSYIEISNFYTVTVYNKGAEVVRMIHTMLGAVGFRAGSDYYFDQYDGQAVTVEDFVSAMESKNNIDLGQFMQWYHQAGTPIIEFQENYDEKNSSYTLTLRQSCNPTPGQASKENFHIPVRIALLNNNGEFILLNLDQENKCIDQQEWVLNFTTKQQDFKFTNVTEKPILSLLRGFSAPVKISSQRSRDELAFLFANDTDDFNRWDAGQTLALEIILSLINDYKEGKQLSLDVKYIQAFEKTLCSENLDNALKAQALSLPSEFYIAEQCDIADPEVIRLVYVFVRKCLAEKLELQFLKFYRNLELDSAYQFNAKNMGRRSLRNTCLSYLVELEKPEYFELCVSQINKNNNMTEVLLALRLLTNFKNTYRDKCLEIFYTKWQHDPLVIDKWFEVQAQSRLPDTLNTVKSLMSHQSFKIKNPNKVRALIGRFCFANQAIFHKEDGSGYLFLMQQVLILDKFNPQVAARFIQAFSQWRNYNIKRQDQMKNCLEKIMNENKLSKDVYEIVSKTLKA